MTRPEQNPPKHLFPLWIRWGCVIVILLLIIGGTVLWIIQGTQAIIPIAIITALGVLIAFFQSLPSIFPEFTLTARPMRTTEESNPDLTKLSPPVSPTLPPAQPIIHSQTSDSTGNGHVVGQAPDPSVHNTSATRRSTSVSFSGGEWLNTSLIKDFYGREAEIVRLTQWLVDDRCRIISVVGLGGIGKTCLVMKVIHQVATIFSPILWFSLKDALPLKSILQECIQILSQEQQTDFSGDTDQQIALLLSFLRRQRCSIILDNFESLLQSGTQSGLYREGYADYQHLLQAIGETDHQSCILLTGRERPQEVIHLEAQSSLSRLCQLEGLDIPNGQMLLKQGKLSGSENDFDVLINRYAGNPLALKLVSKLICELFGGNIASFLQEGETIFSDIQDVLKQQFARLSPQEQEVMYWLAIEREPISLNNLYTNLVPTRPKRDLQEVLRSLRRRDLIEVTARGFSLQNVVMEYVTDCFIEQIAREFVSATLTLFITHPLMKAQAKDYVRNSQIRVIVQPLIQRLMITLSNVRIKDQTIKIISDLRKTKKVGFAAGSLLNLLLEMQYNVTGYDFSYLSVWQAYLQGAELHKVNFAYTDLSSSVFTESFTNIMSVAFSPDATLLAVGSGNGDIRLWQVTNGTPYIYQGHTQAVRSVVFSPDGHYLASGSDDQTVRLWDVASGVCLRVLHKHTNRVWKVDFSPDSKLLASCGDDQTVRLWNVQTGVCLKTLHEHENRVTAVTFSANGSMLASGSDDHTIRLWHIPSEKSVKTFFGHNDRVWPVLFTSDDQLLISGSDDQTVRIWDVQSGDCLKVLQGHTNWVQGVALSPDGHLLATCGGDKFIRLWDIQSGTAVNTLYGHTVPPIASVSFSSDGKLLASGGDDKTVRLWEVSSGTCIKVFQGYNNRILQVAFSPKGHGIASCGDDQAVHLWDWQTGQQVKTFHGHTAPVWTVAFDPEETILASGGEDQIIHLWDTHSGALLKALHGHNNTIRSTAFHANGNLLASASDDHTVRIWDSKLGLCIKVLDEPTNRVWAIAFSPDGNTLVSSDDDQAIHIWDVPSWQHLRTLTGHVNRIRTVAFNSQGNILASGSEDQNIRLWNIRSGETLHILKGHANSVTAVSFGSDENILVSGSEDQTVRVWDINSGQCLKVLSGHTNRLWSVDIHPDGNTIVSGGDDSIMRIWDRHTGLCLKMLQSERPYEGMNIVGTKGITNSQKATLKALGAIEQSEIKDRVN